MDTSFEWQKSVPPGQYTGVFLGCELTDHPEYGPGRRWDWSIEGGPFDGETVSRTTGVKGSAKNAAGKMFRAITGGANCDDFAAFIGSRYALIVEEAPSGNGTRVASVVLLADDASQS